MKLEDAEQIQEVLRNDIVEYYNKGEYYEFLKLIDTFSIFSTYFNNIMSDSVIEKLLENFVKKEIGVSFVKPKKNTVLLYDQVGTTICLGVQYLRGLVSAGFDVFYIFDSIYVDIDNKLLEEIKNLHVDYKIFDKSYHSQDPVFRTKVVRDFIINTNASKVVVHSPANNSYSSCVLYSLEGLIKYRIVPGDHHFYSGVNCIDYFYEFRDYGVGIANIFRKIPIQKIIRLPFYPVVNSYYDFEGFPDDTQNKLIILSAGAENKFFGSDLFFNVSRYILEKYPNTVIVHIGSFSYKFSNFVKSNKLEKRFFLLGFRKDFSDCVKKCDILLSSYPMIGGLVSQIAASYKKPILGIIENSDLSMFNDIGKILGINEDLGITHSSKIDLFDYIDKLLENKEFREILGERIYSKMFKEDSFNVRLKESLISPQSFSQEEYDKETVLKNKIAFSNYSLSLQNERRPTCIVPLYNFYGMKFIIKFPMLLGLFVKLMFMHIADKFFK